MMKNILLLTPISSLKNKASIGMYYNPPNIGLAYIASYLAANGYNVSFIDMKFSSMEYLLNYIKDQSISVVGISAYTSEIANVKRMTTELKQGFPNLKIIIGGAHVSALPVQTLEEDPNVDFGIFGEGEETMLDLVNFIHEVSEKSDISAIPGISHRTINGDIVKNNPRQRIMNLEKLPFPAWNLFDLSKYSSYMERTGFFHKKLELPIVTQRGCPFNCIFCQKILGSQVVSRPVENVLDEINYLVQHYKPDQLAFLDEIFCFNRNRIIELCKKLIEMGINKKLTWVCSTRVDQVDEELLKHMYEAGCNKITMGIEAGNPHILKIIKKGIQIEQAHKAFSLAKKVGMKTHCGIIYGHPFETKETLKDSLKVALSVNPDMISFSLMTPFPGTTIRKMAESNEGGLVILDQSWNLFDKQLGGSLELKNISIAYLKKWQFYSYLRFYLRPSRIRYIFTLVNIKAIPKYLYTVIKSIFKRN